MSLELKHEFNQVFIEQNNTPILAKDGGVIFFKHSKLPTKTLKKALSMVSDIEYTPQDGDIVAERIDNKYMVLNVDRNRSHQELKIVFNDVMNYSHKYIKQYFHKAIPAPNPFDCWSCYYPIHYGSQHLWIHVYKPDYPGALLVSSIRDNAFCLLEPYEKQQFEFGKLFPSELLINNLAQFLCRKLSIPM